MNRTLNFTLYITILLKKDVNDDIFRAIEDAIEESLVPHEVSTEDSAVHLPSFQDFIGM